MATEATTKAYQDLLQLDQHLHEMLDSWQGKEKAVSLRKLQADIERSLPEETEDSTSLLRTLREKKYG